MEVSFILIDLITNLQEVQLVTERKELVHNLAQNLLQVNVLVILPMAQVEMDILRKFMSYSKVFTPVK